MSKDPVAVKPAIGFGLLVAALIAMAMTPNTRDGLPRSDLWVAFLVYVLGPAGIVALALALPWVEQKRMVALLVVPIAYVIGVAACMVLAVNLGVIAP